MVKAGAAEVYDTRYIDISISGYGDISRMTLKSEGARLSGKTEWAIGAEPSPQGKQES